MANLIPSDPFTELARFDPFSGLEDFLAPRRMRSRLRELGDEPAIRMDVTEDEAAYRVKAEIPGARKEDIRVSVDGNTVEISAEVKREKEECKGETVIRSERYYGRQSRSFTLRQDVDSAKAEAKYESGVLQLVLPKKAGGATRQISIL
jgi:HSP20 family protein